MSDRRAGEPDPDVVAREIIDSNQYLTLATADSAGKPWASPVWYAHGGYTSFLWVSRTGAQHSRNIAVRATIGGVIFDSTVAAGQGQAVYLEAVAEQLAGADAERAIAIFSERARALALSEWTLAEVTEPAPFRLYRATASSLFILGATDERVPVHIGDRE